MEVSKAQTELENLGFVVKVTYSASDSMAREYVIDQSVVNGVNLETGKEITLTVSSGQEKVAVPDFQDKDVSAAVADLNRLGFKSRIIEEFSDNIDENKVIGTRPSAGTRTNLDTEIIIRVSKGPETKLVTVPDVTWYSVGGAIELLNAYGLQSYTTYQESDSMAGYVISQYPYAGEEVEEWTWINLVVGIEPETVYYNDWSYEPEPEWTDQPEETTQYIEPETEIPPDQTVDTGTEGETLSEQNAPAVPLEPVDQDISSAD